MHWSPQYKEKLLRSVKALKSKVGAPTLRSGGGTMENGGSNGVIMKLFLKN